MRNGVWILGMPNAAGMMSRKAPFVMVVVPREGALNVGGPDSFVLGLTDATSNCGRGCCAKTVRVNAQRTATVSGSGRAIRRRHRSCGFAPTIVARLKAAEERRQALAARVASLAEASPIVRHDWRAIERQARERLNEWRAVLGRQPG